jgi:phage-related protein
MFSAARGALLAPVEDRRSGFLKSGRIKQPALDQPAVRDGGVVVEVRESYDGNAYRAVYTVRYAESVFVLHAFQKKSKTGMATPRADMDLVRRRLNDLVEEMEKRK